MLVVNYGKFQNATLTIGNVPLKAPEALHIPEHEKTAPAKSFRASEKLRLNVKISTAKEPGTSPFISLNTPVKAGTEKTAPARKAATRKPKTAARKAASKSFRPVAPLKLRVKVSSAAPKEKARRARTVPGTKKPSSVGSTPAKKGK